MSVTPKCGNSALRRSMWQRRNVTKGGRGWRRRDLVKYLPGRAGAGCRVCWVCQYRQGIFTFLVSNTRWFGLNEQSPYSIITSLCAPGVSAGEKQRKKLKSAETADIRWPNTHFFHAQDSCVTWAALIGRYSRVTSGARLWLALNASPRHVNRGQASMAVDAQWLTLVKCLCHAPDRSGYNRRLLWNVSW